MITLHNILVSVSAEVFLIIAAIAILILGVLRKNNITPNTSGKIAFLVFFIACLMVFFTRNLFHENYLQAFLVNNKLTAYFKIIILFVAMGNVLLATEWLNIKKFKRFEYPAFLIFSVVGMMITVSAKCFITLYLGLELLSLPLYILAVFKRRASRATLNGARFLGLGLIISVFYLYGASLIYGITGSLNFQNITDFVANNDRDIFIIVGFFMIIASLLFKCDIAIFNFSIGDIAEGSPTPVTAFLLTAPKIACFGILIRLCNEVFAPILPSLVPMFIFFALLSMVLGTIAMVAQTNIKRLMAFCSMTYSGYMLASFAGMETKGATAILFLLSSYSVAMVGIFSVILSLRKNGNLIENIADIRGFADLKPLPAMIFTFFMFSIIGFPPLAGFYGMFHLLTSLIANKFFISIIFVIISIMLIMASFVKVISIIYFKKTDEPFDDIGFYNGTVMFLCLAVISIFCMYPFLISKFAESVFFHL